MHGLPSQDWPEGLASPAAHGVDDFRVEQADRIDFHCWMQWALDRQLGEVQRRAKDAGMALGVIHDLAVGVHPHGADAWALRHALAKA